MSAPNGRLRWLSVGQPREVQTPRGVVTTAIFKTPVDDRRHVIGHNIDGDRQADLESHGGENKAVYAYPFEHYALFADALGRDDFEPAQFGENLTTEALLEKEVCLGDVYRIGTAKLQVSQPRQPCAKLGLRMGDPTFPKRFLASGRLGIYFRVEEEGEIGAGDVIECVGRASEPVSLQDVWRATFGDARGDAELIDRILRFETLGPEWRIPLERRLAHG